MLGEAISTYFTRMDEATSGHGLFSSALAQGSKWGIYSWAEQGFLVMEDEDSAAGLRNICIDIRQSRMLNTYEEWRLWEKESNPL